MCCMLEDSRLDTVQCLWEYVIDCRHEYAAGRKTPFNVRMERLFDDCGSPEVRRRFRDSILLDACDDCWMSLKARFGAAGRFGLFSSYDYAYVPAFLEICVDAAGFLHKDWKERLLAAVACG